MTAPRIRAAGAGSHYEPATSVRLRVLSAERVDGGVEVVFINERTRRRTVPMEFPHEEAWMVTDTRVVLDLR